MSPAQLAAQPPNAVLLADSPADVRSHAVGYNSDISAPIIMVTKPLPKVLLLHTGRPTALRNPSAR